ncbi:MAG TPA: cell wall hydrolase, partial [Polymorphobacter sp.]|nr:cell wall hydrolase [Polymorphobacter sp.]
MAGDVDAPLSETRDAAVSCMATAIAYEAGTEPAQGQAAVAQVILNRMHHPAFPKSVCGVVYQGSARRTGCQFTFT